jgi:enediyne polyketide synthase
VAALVRAPERVECVLRCASTGFAADHFRATCRFSSPENPPAPPAGEGGGDPPVPLDPAELYGGVLFHGGRFRRVARYRRLHGFRCVAEIAADGTAPWFAPWLPPALLLGDPAARDATLHAIQACIPHALVLPVAIARLTVFRAEAAGARTLFARETAREGDELAWEVDVRGAAGEPVERWEGLRLRIVSPLEMEGGWPPALLGPFAERRVAELVPGAAVSVAVERGDGDGANGDRRARSDAAIRRALGTAGELRRREDGRPEAVDGEVAVSAAHAGELALAVAAPDVAGCDLEPVAPRSAEVWRDLLGAERAGLAALVSAEMREEGDTAATRLWCAAEALKKAGAPADAPLVLASASPDGWVLLRAGALAVATWAGPVRRRSGVEPMALAVVARAGPVAHGPFRETTGPNARNLQPV